MYEVKHFQCDNCGALPMTVLRGVSAIYCPWCNRIASAAEFIAARPSTSPQDKAILNLIAVGATLIGLMIAVRAITETR